jgi:dolichyl-phosphate-mannose-protein mannosyltransferase
MLSMKMKAFRWLHYPELVGLIVLAFATRIWMLFSPNAIVFDEVYFKAFAAHYQDGRYYFDIHPPLAKLILGAQAALTHLSSSAMINGTAVSLRIIPALAGVILVPVVWGILRRLGASRPFAFLGGLAVLLDNAILVESRFILTDSMLLLFGLSAVYFYLVSRDNKGPAHWFWLALAAAGAGASMSVKWTGLNALAVVCLVWAWDQRGRLLSLGHRALELAILLFIPALIYISVFWIHLSLLPNTGDGDAFMTTEFQSTLKGSAYYNESAHMSFFSKLIELNKEMYHANQTLTATHPYGSHWYTWPLEERPIYYWQGDTTPNGSQGNIYLLGNPVIWWGIWISIITGLLYLWVMRRKLQPATIAGLSITVVAYFINLLPFVAVTRVMFLYHYFFSFLYSLIFSLLLWNDLAKSPHGKQLEDTRDRRIYIGVIVAIVLGFIFFSPLSYGWPLSPTALKAHMWLRSWR